jgi:FAD/FMN-containing dehydrogenase
MDPERTRIQDDLRGLVAGDVRCDDVSLRLYASDASIYQLQPLGTVRPRSAADVSTVVRYAAEKRLPIHARGAGTGLAGESLGRGIVVDFSRYMRRIVRTDSESIRVQPGLIHALLNEHLRGQGRVFGPDPANSNVTTMGSVIALDASGSYWRRYGSARRHVQKLQVALADGTIVEVGREALPPADSTAQATNGGHTGSDVSSGRHEVEQPTAAELRRREIVDKLRILLKHEAPLIAERHSKALVNRCGYQLSDVLSETHLDLARLLCGSEGTLALVTEAVIATQQLPGHRGVAMLFFDRLESAALAIEEIQPYDPCACDLLDRRHLGLARETRPEYEVLIPAGAEAVLLVEHSGDDAAAVRDRLNQTVDRVRRKKQLAFDARQAFDSADVDLFWQLTRRVVPTLHRLKGNIRPIPVVEDVAVPPRALPEFLVRLQNILKQHQITASLYAHAGHGQLHIRPFLDLAVPDEVRKMEELADDLYADVLNVGGTISGEHGAGLSRTQFVRRQFGPLYEVFREVKRIFDPLNILNPGKVVADEPSRVGQNLRPAERLLALSSAAPSNNASNGQSGISAAEAQNEHSRAAGKAPFVELQLNWTPQEFLDEAGRCNGCGACRSQLGDVRMCPIFRVLPAEEASPRAKANLLRAIFDGGLDPQILAREEFKQVTDLCVNCHQCHLECPAGVDIPKLMIEAKAA